MRIKKITSTNRFRHIEFATIENDWFGREVYTPSGWSKIKAFDFIKNGLGKCIRTEGFELICDPGHVLQATIDGKLFAVTAQDLDPSIHKLVGYNGPVDFEICDSGNHDFYDIEISDPHWWYTSGVVSHNSIVLCNNAITSLKGMNGDGLPGQNVLLITFELDTIKTAMRCLGAATGVELNDIPEKQGKIDGIISQMKKTYGKRFVIFEWPPEECSVSHIYALLDNLRRTESFHPDVIILDYMDLMISRNPALNKDDYTRQKHVANEIRGLAKNENVLVFTATQTNRSGASDDGGMADLSKAAESYAKQFSLDYVVSLNQSDSQRAAKPPRMSMFIAKNRNGPKHQTVNCAIDYRTMKVQEER